MIIENTHAVKTNLKGSTEFSVSEDSAKIFSFLSNFLYKDKERSVITELCSNAVDAHKMVGKEKTPILVCLPTHLQKEFRVRDYGPGLSEEDVYRFLTKYGSSSKTGSNDFIGGFGIGSKSPAAISDTWNITSNHEGISSSYLIHINDKGIPNINKIFSCPTAESGLEVIVPTSNINNWHVAAQKAFQFYEVMPDVKGAAGAGISNIKFVLDYKGLIKFSDNSESRTSSSKLSVILNNRSYDLDISKIDGALVHTEFHGYLQFNIGALSVSLSREDLQYDTKTISAIRERLMLIDESLKADWFKDVTPITSIFEYQIAANKFRSEFKVSSSAIRMFAVYCKDAVITPALNKVDFCSLSRFTISLTKDDLLVQCIDRGSIRNLKPGKHLVGHSSVSYSSIGYTNDTKQISFSCSDKSSITFVMRDIKGTPSRVKAAAASGSIKDAAILDKVWFDMIPDCFNKILASSLDKVVTVRKKRAKVVKSDIFVRNKQQFLMIEESDLDKSAPIVCVRFTSMITARSIIDPFDVKFVNEFSKEPGLSIIYIKEKTTMPIYAITANDYLQTTYKQSLKNKQDMIDSANRDSIIKCSKGNHSLAQKLCRDPQKFVVLPDTTVMGKIARDIERIRGKMATSLTLASGFDILHFNKCASMLGLPILKSNINEQEILMQLRDSYPMMSFLNNHYIEDRDVKTVIEYVELCGK